MRRYERDFTSKLPDIDFSYLEKHKDTVFGLSSNLELIYFNPAWNSFAAQNGGAHSVSKQFPLGTSIKNSLPRVLADFYIENYNRVMEQGDVWHHCYECSSKHFFRLYRQTTSPLKNRKGLLIFNELRMKIPFRKTNSKNHNACEETYLQNNGYINQCVNCRSVQRVDRPYNWDRVSRWIEKLHPRTLNVMCPVCSGYYGINEKGNHSE